MTRVVRTTCKIGACEPFCGIELEVDGDRLVGVRPDPRHPITRGHACIKGMHVPDYVNDPERLLHPLRRGVHGLERVSWETAIGGIGGALRRIRELHGPRAIATYWGNAADSASIVAASTLCHAFGSPNSFNVLSLEYTDRGAVAQRVLGNENYVLQPDADRAQFALLLGTNPIVTQGMSLLQRRPNAGGALRGIRKRGGRVVVVDPRRTETARIADEHLAIRPGTDLFLLVSMIRQILETGLYDRAAIARHANGVDAWLEAARGLEADRAAEITGIEADRIASLAVAFARAERAFATTRVGVQTSPNTTLTEWAVLTLNAITGNVDRPGGVYWNPGAFDVPRLVERFSARRNASPSRIGGYPQVFGGPPCSVFSEDVLSDDPDRIRALIVVAGNPVISFPDTARIEAALRRLDLLVCIDIYPSDTCAFAHWALPAATLYEKGGLHFLTSNFEPRPFLEWKPRVLPARGEARSEWSIVKDLSRAAGVPFLNDPRVDWISRVVDALGASFDESWLHRLLLLGKPGLGRLKRTPGGIVLGEIRFGEWLARGLPTVDGRMQLAPIELVEALGDALADPPIPGSEWPFLLVSGARRLASFNSWTHHIAALTEKLGGNWATIHPDDARALGVKDGDRVRIRSRSGSIEITAKTSHDIRPGVVSVHQLWGHVYQTGTSTSRRHPGVNVNHLHADDARDRFSGMPVLNGTHCRIDRL